MISILFSQKRSIHSVTSSLGQRPPRTHAHKHTHTHVRAHAQTHAHTHARTHPLIPTSYEYTSSQTHRAALSHTRRKQTWSTFPSGNINGMINRTPHTRRKQTLSPLFQLEVTSNPPRLPRSLSAETDSSTLHKNPPTVTLGGNRPTSLPSSLHSRRRQTCQLCAKTVRCRNGITSLPSSLHSRQKTDMSTLCKNC